MFRKKENLVGLDVGSSYIKMVQVEAHNTSIRLLNLGLIPLPAEAFQEGRLKKSEPVVAAIQQLAGHLKIKEKLVAASIPGYEVMIKKIGLPMMTEEELDSRMQVELGQYIPYNLDEVDVDYQILDISKDRSNFMDVLLVAAKKESINEYVEIIRVAGFEPAVVDVDFFALGNAFEATHGLGEENVALLDIGASKAILNIIHRGVPLFTRGITIGGDQITEPIQEHFRIPREEAEQIKLGGASEKYPVKELEEVFVSTVRNWVSEFKRAINFFYTNFPDSRVTKIFLSGGSSRIPGLDNVFRENMDAEVEVTIFNPLKHLIYDTKVFDAAYLDYLGPQMAISLGLALRKMKK
jgi:type IV pilus assembly protein PilM